MDALQHYYVHIGHPIEWLEPSTTWESQQALCACALTCHAWRTRAQHLLWTSPYLFNGQRLARFNAIMRNPPNVAITTLMLGDHDSSPSQSLDLSAASELFMHLSSHPERLQCANILFDRGPPAQVLRMRLPFFANIAVLRLYRCTFQSLRAMLDVVWACQNLATLVIYGSVSKSGHSSAAGIENMATALGHKQACGKLTNLCLDASTVKASPLSIAHLETAHDVLFMQQVWDPASLGPIGGGRLFGDAVTELVFSSNYAGSEEAGTCNAVYLRRTTHFLCFIELLSSLLNHCFPALRSITVISLGRPVLVEGIRELSWLHIIARALDQQRTGTLKSIVIEGRHNAENNDCCREAVGTSEEVVGSKRRLPELFIGLAELVIRSNRHATEPRKCAAYVRSVLPGMRDVLRFELEQASSMEDCYLTIGLCEEVMNTLHDHKLLEGDHASWPSYDRVPEWQQALHACALTCRAWRARAQHLLWTIPHLSDNRHFAQFTTAIRNTPNISIIITGLALGPGDNSYGVIPLDLSTAGELFISSFPHLQRLLCNSIRFDRGPPLHMLRMRLPFFVGITTLRLLNCTFQSLRAMLDIVWACTNLATLDIYRANFNSKPYSPARLQQMLDAMYNLRAGWKLATLYLDSCTLEACLYFQSHIYRPLTTYCLYRKPGTPLPSHMAVGVFCSGTR